MTADIRIVMTRYTTSEFSTTDVGSGWLIVESEITEIRDKEIDHTKEVTGHERHHQKSMEGINVGCTDASIHRSLFVADVRSRSFVISCFQTQLEFAEEQLVAED